MGRALLILSAFFLCLGSPATLLAGDWFVDAVNGNDANAGTAPGAGNAFETITQALSVAGTGDCITVAAGTYDTGLGETFPLVIPDGVSLEGAGKTTTTIDASGSGFRGILISTTHTNTTIIQGFEIVNDSSRDCVAIAAPVADFQILKCTLTGGEDGIEYSGSDTGVVGFLASCNMFTGFANDGIEFGHNRLDGTANVTVVNNTFDGDGTGNRGIKITAYCQTGDTGLLNVNVSSNALADLSGQGISVWAGASANGELDMTARIANNTVTDFGSLGIYLSGWADGTSASLLFLGGVTGNILTMGDRGMAFSNWASTTNAQAQGQLTVSDNFIDGMTGTGIWQTVWASVNANQVLDASFVDNTVLNVTNTGWWIELWADSGASNDVTLDLDGNTVAENSDTGIYFDLWADDTGTLVADLDIAYNCIRDNGNSGIGYSASAITNGVATIDARFHGNVIQGNSGNGVWVVSSESLGGSLTNSLDWGGGAMALGRNVISGNTAAVQFRAQGSVEATILAVGNWWGTQSLAAIEGLVEHDADNAAYPDVDFSMPLADPLVFSGPGSVSPGLIVVIAAALGSAFVPYAGDKDILVTLNGVLVANPNVSPDGSLLSFIVPFLLFGGTQTLVITNPGGQAGALVLLVLSGVNPSNCFVATASYGDLLAPEVRVLQRWRDECLAENAIGRQLVKAYYALSPGLAEAIAERPWARTVSRAALAPVVGTVRLWLHMPWAFGLAGAALAWRLLRKRTT